VAPFFPTKIPQGKLEPDWRLRARAETLDTRIGCDRGVSLDAKLKLLSVTTQLHQFFSQCRKGPDGKPRLRAILDAFDHQTRIVGLVLARKVLHTVLVPKIDVCLTRVVADILNSKRCCSANAQTQQSERSR